MELNWKDFNEMSHNNICKLPGIGKKVADRIVSMRPFRCNNDMFKIRGLGARTLKKLGIEKDVKERRTWVLMEDGIGYPTYALALNTLTNKIDFFWRIPKDRRQYL